MATDAALNRPIKSLPFARPAAGGAASVKVGVTEMTTELVLRWHKHVQPRVDRLYAPAARPGGRRTRADVGWDWRRILAFSRLYAWASAGLPSSGPSLGLSMVVDTGATGGFPIGMLICVPRLQTNVLGSLRDRGFGWFLSNAPSEVYAEVLQCPGVRGVAEALLDCGIQASQDRGHDGSFLLHADPNGGARLQDFYRLGCGMTQLPADAPPITPVFRRARTDEYFHFDAPAAEAFCRRFDPRR